MGEKRTREREFLTEEGIAKPHTPGSRQPISNHIDLNTTCSNAPMCTPSTPCMCVLPNVRGTRYSTWAPHIRSTYDRLFRPARFAAAPIDYSNNDLTSRSTYDRPLCKRCMCVACVLHVCLRALIHTDNPTCAVKHAGWTGAACPYLSFRRPPAAKNIAGTRLQDPHSRPLDDVCSSKHHHHHSRPLRQQQRGSSAAVQPMFNRARSVLPVSCQAVPA